MGRRGDKASCNTRIAGAGRLEVSGKGDFCLQLAQTKITETGLICAHFL